MERKKTVGVALGVLAAGVCAALPFRRTDVTAAPQAPPKAAELVLNQPANVVNEPAPPAPDPPPMDEPHPDSSSQTLGSIAIEKPAAATSLEAPAAAPAPAAAEQPQVVARPATPDNSAPPPRYTTWRRHRIRDGDTLAKLAQTYLGDAAREGEIFALNRDVLADPNLLPIGRWLRIPPEDRSATEPSSNR